MTKSPSFLSFLRHCVVVFVLTPLDKYSVCCFFKFITVRKRREILPTSYSLYSEDLGRSVIRLAQSMHKYVYICTIYVCVEFTTKFPTCHAPLLKLYCKRYRIKKKSVATLAILGLFFGIEKHEFLNLINDF